VETDADADVGENESVGRATERDTRAPWGDPQFRVVVASTLAGVLGVTLVTPVVPLLPAVLGVTDSAASLLITAYTLPGVFFSPVAGVLADRHGRRSVLVWSLVCFSLAGVAVLAVQEFSAVLLLRGLQGVGASGLFAVAVTLIGDTYEGVQRNAALGANGAAISVGAAVYPLFGGAIATLGWKAPFAVYAVGLLVAGWAFRAVEEAPIENPRSGFAYVRGALQALPVRSAVALYGTTIVTFVLLFGGVFTAIPFLLARVFTEPVPLWGDVSLAPSALIGVVLTTNALTTAVVAARSGPLAARFTDRTLLVFGLTAYGLGLVVAWVGGTPVWLTLGVLVVGVGQGLVLPPLDAKISSLAPRQYRAGSLSLRTSAAWLGTTIGPVAFTTLAALPGSDYRLLLLGGGLGAFAVAGLLARPGTLSEAGRTQAD
jgi:MFS family permease